MKGKENEKKDQISEIGKNGLYMVRRVKHVWSGIHPCKKEVVYWNIFATAVLLFNFNITYIFTRVLRKSF